MLVRKLTGFASMTQMYAFGVDAKKVLIGVPKEVHQNESRVAITPDTVQRVIKKNGIWRYSLILSEEESNT